MIYIIAKWEKSFFNVNLLQVQSLSCFPSPETTPLAEGQSVHVVAPLALYLSASHFVQESTVPPAL